MQHQENGGDQVIYSERTPPVPLGEMITGLLVTLAVVNAAVLVVVKVMLKSDAWITPGTWVVHALITALSVAVFALIWKQKRNEAVLIVFADKLKLTECGAMMVFPRGGTLVKRCRIRGRGASRDSVVIFNATVDKAPRNLPERLTGATDAFCGLLSSNGWRISEP